MPIYEYSCPSCGHHLEKIQSFNAEAPTCPKCEQGPMEKLISNTSFVLKGGGWYKDGYSGGGNAPPSSSSSSNDSSD